MVETTLNDNINAFNAAILPILNGTVLSTHVEPVIKQQLDMHQKPVEDIFLTMGSADIMILKDTMITTSWESADEHVLFMYVYFSTI
jgi:hypothetical protein